MELVISVRRAHRDDVPEDWVDQVLHIEGVTALGDPLFGRITVSATAEGRAILERAFGETCIIEPVIRHRTQKPTGD